MIHKPGVNGQLMRGHSFINRTPHTVLTASLRKSWPDVVGLLVEACGKGAANVRCLRVQQCRLQGSELCIPSAVQQQLLQNITKLVVTNCKATSLPLPSLPCLLQLDLSHNSLPSIPAFLYSSPQLARLNLSHNRIDCIDNRLCILDNLRYIGLMDNRVVKVGVGFCLWARWGKLGVEFEWGLAGLCGWAGSKEDMTKRTGTTITETDYQPNCDEQTPKEPPPQSNQYLCLPQSLSSLDPSSPQTGSQLQALLLTENSFYLEMVVGHLTAQLCDKYIELCFGERKYVALDFVVTRRVQIEGERGQGERVLMEVNVNGQLRGKQNKQPTKVVRKKIKMLHPKPFPPSSLTLPILLTLNPKTYPCLPVSSLHRITRQELIYLLNEMQAHPLKTSQHIQEVFESEAMRRICANAISGEQDLEEVVTGVQGRVGLRGLLLWGDLQLFADYDFASVTLLKAILRLEDYELVRKFEQKYPKFSQALFGNMPRSLSFTTINPCSSPAPPTACPQHTSWKHLVPPTSKLYKPLYKSQKQYIALQLGTPHSKNLHFPEYIPVQSMLIRNDVHDYEILRDYEEFQASCFLKDLKLRVRQGRNEDQCSLAKRIYLRVVEEAGLRVRDIGKSREKARMQKQGKVLNKTSLSFNCLNQVQSQKTEREPSMLSWTRSSHKQDTLHRIGQKMKQISKSSNKKILSIQQSARKQQKENKKKKNGILIFRTLDQAGEKENAPSRKTIYLDLSQNRTITSIINSKSVKKQSESSRTENGSSLARDTARINGLQIQCSTFDIS